MCSLRPSSRPLAVGALRVVVDGRVQDDATCVQGSVVLRPAREPAWADGAGTGR